MYPHAECHPRQAQTGAGSRAPAAAEGVRAAVERPLSETRLGEQLKVVHLSLSRRRPFSWLYDARGIVRWIGVFLSLVSVAFAALSYFGFWSSVRGDDLLAALANRLDTSYATDVSRQVRQPDPEWRPLLRVIRSYSPKRGILPKDREPVVFARFAAVASAKSEAGEWTASTTPIVLLYKEWPSPGNSIVPGQDGWIIGTLGDFHEWIRKDEADFDFLLRTVILGALSACVGLFLALPERRKPVEESEGLHSGRAAP